MRLLIDECVLGKTAKLLKRRGFSLITLQQLRKTSVTNGMIIQIAKKEKAVIITNDLDFANLILYPLGSHEGIIVLRPRLNTLQAINDVHKILMRLFKEVKPADLAKALVIVGRNKYRIRK